MTVREGENATLICRAKGHPVPRIIWKREDGDHLLFKSGPREIIKGKHLSIFYIIFQYKFILNTFCKMKAMIIKV